MSSGIARDLRRSRGTRVSSVRTKVRGSTHLDALVPLFRAAMAKLTLANCRRPSTATVPAGAHTREPDRSGRRKTLVPRHPIFFRDQSNQKLTYPDLGAARHGLSRPPAAAPRAAPLRTQRAFFARYFWRLSQSPSASWLKRRMWLRPLRVLVETAPSGLTFHLIRLKSGPYCVGRDRHGSLRGCRNPQPCMTDRFSTKFAKCSPPTATLRPLRWPPAMT